LQAVALAQARLPAQPALTPPLQEADEAVCPSQAWL
jgi:hypothetical protein